MRPSAYPTIVDLKNLPLEGESYSFSRQTKELEKSLKDLVPNKDYHVDLTIKPIGNVFEISGKITTELDLICARCGRDLSLPIHDEFHELIVVTAEKPRAGHSGHTGSELDDGPYCNYLTRYALDLGEFVREHVAAAEPYTPYCNRTDCESFLHQAQKSLSEESTLNPNPFADLKKVRLPSQRD